MMANIDVNINISQNLRLPFLGFIIFSILYENKGTITL